MNKQIACFINVVILCISLLSFECMGMSSHLPTNRAVDKVVAKYSITKEPLLMAKFLKSGVTYPPKKIALLAFKKEQNIELWAQDSSQSWRYISSYPLTAYSGILGPKLKENDGQIPEGIYKLTMFNPFSRWHLSLMINYPNDFDRSHALREGRHKLGGDIFIHGKNSSVGCLAIGDNAIEQIFLLSRRVGLQNVELIIAPNDLRKSQAATSYFNQPRWLPELYQKIRYALDKYPLKKNTQTLRS